MGSPGAVPPALPVPSSRQPAGGGLRARNSGDRGRRAPGHQDGGPGSAAGRATHRTSASWTLSPRARLAPAGWSPSLFHQEERPELSFLTILTSHVGNSRMTQEQTSFTYSLSQDTWRRSLQTSHRPLARASELHFRPRLLTVRRQAKVIRILGRISNNTRRT